MANRVVFVHGFCGNPGNHWFPWLEKELTGKGFTVIAPAMPSPDKPKLADWLSALSTAVGVPDADTYFVGHSLGCVTILHYLARLPSEIKVGGAVLVAGFIGDVNEPAIAEFYATEDEIKPACDHGPFVSILSSNDSDVPPGVGYEFSRCINADATFEDNKGHFCADDGVMELPSARDAVLRLAGLSTN